MTRLPGGGGDYLYGIVDWPPPMRYGYDMKTVARTTVNVLAVDGFTTGRARSRTSLGDPATAAADGGRAGAARGRDEQRSCAGPTACSSTASRPTARRARTRRSRRTPSRSRTGRRPRGDGRRVPPASYVAALGIATGPMNGLVLLRALHASGRDADVVRAPHRPQATRLGADRRRGRDVHVGELDAARRRRRQQVARLGIERARRVPGGTCSG